MNLKVIFAILAVLFCAGCESPSYLDPRIAHISGDLLLTTSSISENKDISNSFTVYAKTSEKKFSLKTVGTYYGEVVAYINKDDKLYLIFADSSIYSVADLKDPQLLPILEGDSQVQVFAASAYNGKILAWVKNAQGEMTFLEYLPGSDKWQDSSVKTPTPFTPAFSEMVALSDDSLALFLRRYISGIVTPGIMSFIYDNNHWSNLPLPPGKLLSGGFAVCAEGSEILLLRDAGREMEQADGMPLSRYTAKGWAALPSVPFSEAQMKLPGAGIDIKKVGSTYYVARSDATGLQLLMANDIDNGNWNRLDVGMSREFAFSENSMLFLLLFIFVALSISFRIIIKRQIKNSKDSDEIEEMLEAIEASKIGGVATIFDRALAMFLDSALVLPVLLYSLDNKYAFWDNIAGADEGMAFVLWFLSLQLYCSIAEILFKTTVGKMIVGIRVRSLYGGEPTRVQCFVRSTARAIDFFPVPFFGSPIPYLIALVSASITSRRQRVGDIFAKTVVLRHTPVRKREIVLASGSPRRSELIRSLGLKFSVSVADIDETIVEGLPPQMFAERLALQKCQKVAGSVKRGSLVIAADTVVVVDDKVLGKPASEQDAIEMLQRLSGDEHQVITAVAIIDTATAQELVRSDATTVYMKKLSLNEVTEYVASGEGEDKAGSYAIQGEGGELIERIDGSLSNVIGLPVELLLAMFKDIDG